MLILRCPEGSRTPPIGPLAPVQGLAISSAELGAIRAGELGGEQVFQLGAIRYPERTLRAKSAQSCGDLSCGDLLIRSRSGGDSNPRRTEQGLERGISTRYTYRVPMANSKTLSLFPTPAKASGRPLRRRRALNELGLFAGIGGFEVGLRQAGHKTRMLCEIWEPAVAVLQDRFPRVALVPDVTSLAEDPELIPQRVDLLTAGFPCTDLSQAGMTAGIKGKNSGLVYQVFRILHRRPVPWVILENVPFMLRLKRGRAMGVIVDELERLGYRWAYRVIDSRAFGVPQRRQRVFLLASLEGDPRDVLLSEDAGPEAEPAKDGWRKAACGFYWTEGVRGLGWAHDAVPTLKGGSTVGIPSSPAVAMPDGRLVKPTITDAERMQGFDAGWTAGAESVARVGFRWKLVGNAVTVDVARWLGERLRQPLEYDPAGDQPLPRGSTWPTAAYNVDGKRFVAPVSEWPTKLTREPLVDFLEESDVDLLSARATHGFLNRATSDACNLRFPPGFIDFVQRHLSRVEVV